MTKSSDWKVLSDETSSDPVSDNNEQNDTQSSERKRRLLSGSKPKTHRKYIQDIVTFLKNEALALEEDVKYEHKQNGSDHTVKVSIGGDFLEVKKKTLKTAREAAARDMMAMIGPWVEEDEWKQHVEANVDRESIKEVDEDVDIEAKEGDWRMKDTGAQEVLVAIASRLELLLAELLPAPKARATVKAAWRRVVGEGETACARGSQRGGVCARGMF